MRTQVSLNIPCFFPRFIFSQDVPAACRDRHNYPRPRSAHRHYNMGETAVALGPPLPVASFTENSSLFLYL